MTPNDVLTKALVDAAGNKEKKEGGQSRTQLDEAKNFLFLHENKEQKDKIRAAFEDALNPSEDDSED